MKTGKKKTVTILVPMSPLTPPLHALPLSQACRSSNRVHVAGPGQDDDSLVLYAREMPFTTRSAATALDARHTKMSLSLLLRK